MIPDRRAPLPDAEHVTYAKAVVGTSIQYDDLELSDLGYATDDCDDLPVDLAGRCFREEVERNINRGRNQPVALPGLLLRRNQGH